MTKEQSEAIERIKYLLFIYKKDDEKGYRATGDVFDTDFKAIETVLNMLKEKEAEIEKNTELAEKNAEIEKYKKLLADNLARNLNDSIKAKEKADTDLDDLNKGWQLELEKKDKMIDLMAEYISDLDIDEDICKKQSDNNCDDINREVECKECIKQYFERKAEEN